MEVQAMVDANQFDGMVDTSDERNLRCDPRDRKRRIRSKREAETGAHQCSRNELEQCRMVGRSGCRRYRSKRSVEQRAEFQKWAASGGNLR